MEKNTLKQSKLRKSETTQLLYEIYYINADTVVLLFTALRLSVELLVVSECCASTEIVTEAFPLPFFCFTGHLPDMKVVFHLLKEIPTCPCEAGGEANGYF